MYLIVIPSPRKKIYIYIYIKCFIQYLQYTVLPMILISLYSATLQPVNNFDVCNCVN